MRVELTPAVTLEAGEADQDAEGAAHLEGEIAALAVETGRTVLTHPRDRCHLRPAFPPDPCQ